jgi:hypothetical protein
MAPSSTSDPVTSSRSLPAMTAVSSATSHAWHSTSPPWSITPNRNSAPSSTVATPDQLGSLLLAAPAQARRCVSRRQWRASGLPHERDRPPRADPEEVQRGQGVGVRDVTEWEEHYRARITTATGAATRIKLPVFGDLRLFLVHQGIAGEDNSGRCGVEPLVRSRPEQAYGISRTMIRLVAPLAPVWRPAVITTRAPVGRPANSFAVTRADSTRSSTVAPTGIVRG